MNCVGVMVSRYYFDDNGNPHCLNEEFLGRAVCVREHYFVGTVRASILRYNAETGIYVEESVDAIKRRLVRQVARSIETKKLSLAGKAAHRRPT